MKQEDIKLRDSVVRMLERSGTELELYRRRMNEESLQMEENLNELKLEIGRALAELRKLSGERAGLSPSTSKKLQERYLDLRSQMNSLSEKTTDKWLDTLELVQKQLKGIIRDLSKEKTFSRQTASLTDRIHRIRTKLDMFRIKLKLGSMEARSVWDEGKHNLNQRVSRLKLLSREARRNAGDRVDKFRKEINEAYRHLQKALTNN
jgi:hypothetical protein